MAVENFKIEGLKILRIHLSFIVFIWQLILYRTKQSKE